MPEPRPSVGRIVHYVSYGTPGGEYSSQSGGTWHWPERV